MALVAVNRFWRQASERIYDALRPTAFSMALIHF